MRRGRPIRRALALCRHAGAVAGVVCLAALMGACSPDHSLNRVLGKIGLTCVDALGANSSAEQIANAQLNTEFTDPVTGETKTGMDAALEMAGSVTDVLDLPEHTRDEIRQKTAESVFTDVPAGGDAAFAAAVCDEVNGNVWKALTAQGTTEELLTRTPHLLRAFGRLVCGGIGDSYAEAEFKEQSDVVEKANSDPEAFKAGQLVELRDRLKFVQEDILTNPNFYQPGAVETLQREVDTVASTPAADIAANLKSLLRFQMLAVEHQCPSLSRYGFGPGCGQFNPFPDGDPTGVLRVREGDLSCEEAQTVIRFHYFPAQADPDSPLSLYYCEEGGIEKVEDAPVIFECEAVQGNPKPAKIVVAPT